MSYLYIISQPFVWTMIISIFYIKKDGVKNEKLFFLIYCLGLVMVMVRYIMLYIFENITILNYFDFFFNLTTMPLVISIIFTCFWLIKRKFQDRGKDYD